jgi:hypothetical protein
MYEEDEEEEGRKGCIWGEGNTIVITVMRRAAHHACCR